MTNKEITITELDNLYKLAEEVNGNLCVIKKFFDDYIDIDEFYKIIPLMNYTIKASDDLFLKFIDLKYNN